MPARVWRAVAEKGVKDANRLLAGYISASLILHAFWTYGFTIIPTAGASMVPNLPTFGAAVLISKQYRRGRNIEVGDLVSFDHPMKLGEGVIKRVIGLPGDFVLRDTPEKGDGIMLQVPEGHMWVAGDNQSASRDSRMFGPIPLALVRGKVLAQLYPFKDMHWFKNGMQEPEEDLD
ncbi:peptidase S24/S26A/S26B/S26C [Phyllosticta citrichinensis]|uniref:Peptidase S24/S26A/S26B/S26C n=1 Tax=Phyllosticta citrichinensis TaxID=1130410 RepID=A0ABR1XQY7_9PEZI